MRQRIFTPTVVRELPGMIASGLTVSEIADKIGCTEKTLRQRASDLRISLKTGERYVKNPSRMRIWRPPVDKTPSWARVGIKAVHVPSGIIIKIIAITSGARPKEGYGGCDPGAQCLWGDVRNGGQFSENYSFADLQAAP